MTKKEKVIWLINWNGDVDHIGYVTLSPENVSELAKSICNYFDNYGKTMYIDLNKNKDNS